MFVSFEGPEGSGKTTVLRAVARQLRAEGRHVLTTREPGAGSLGKRIREVLLQGEAMDARCELFLFLADRANHVASVIRPALERGAIVLSDRYADSTVVYQAHARGLDPLGIRELNAFATDGLMPNITILLDLDPVVAFRRLEDPWELQLTPEDSLALATPRLPNYTNRLDAEPMDFHHRVRAGFLVEARREPERWRIVDASRPLAEVEQASLGHVREVLSHEATAMPSEGLG